MDFKKEMAAFRNHLESGLNSKWAIPSVKQNFQTMLDWLDNKTTSSSYSLFFGVLDYFATGEGRTIVFIASGASNEGEFLKHVVREVGWYYAVGIEISRDLKALNNSLIDFIVSPAMQESLLRESRAEEDGQAGGHINVKLSHHANYS